MSQIESKDILKNIFSASSDGIICIDLQGKVLFSNYAFNKMVGYSPAEISEKNISRVIKGENIFGKFMVENKCDGKFYNLNFIRKSGEIISSQAKTWRQINGLSDITTWFLIKENKNNFLNHNVSGGYSNIISNLQEQCRVINNSLKNLNQDLGGNIEDVDDYISYASESCAKLKELIFELAESKIIKSDNGCPADKYNDSVEIIHINKEYI